MSLKRMTLALALLLPAAWGAACASVQIAQVARDEVQATPTAATLATVTTSSLPDASDAVTPPQARQTIAPIAVATPTATLEAASIDEDCMAGCHLPDPNESFGAGAPPLPATHAERTTCLECHTSAAAPALPATHLGRLDVSCRGCHR